MQSGWTGEVVVPHHCGSVLRRFDGVLVAMKELSAGTSSEFDSLYCVSIVSSIGRNRRETGARPTVLYSLAGVATFNMFDGMSHRCAGSIFCLLFSSTFGVTTLLFSRFGLLHMSVACSCKMDGVLAARRVVLILLRNTVDVFCIVLEVYFQLGILHPVQKGHTVEGCVPTNHTEQFREQLKEGSVYTFETFIVAVLKIYFQMGLFIVHIVLPNLLACKKLLHGN